MSRTCNDKSKQATSPFVKPKRVRERLQKIFSIVSNTCDAQEVANFNKPARIDDNVQQSTVKNRDKQTCARNHARGHTH